MKTVWVRLHSLDDIKCFARAAGECPLHITADAGQIRVDARSLMALFCLDLREPVCIRIKGDPDETERFCSKIQAFLVCGPDAVMA